MSTILGTPIYPSRHDRHSYDTFRELREIGAGSAIEGFVRASEAPSVETRQLASYYAASFAAEDAMALEVVKRGLRDPNRRVRGFAVRALSHLQCSAEVMRHPERTEEVVGLVVGQLTDRSHRVRWRAARELYPWATEVDAMAVEHALSAETNRKVRGSLEGLLQRVREQQDQQPVDKAHSRYDEPWRPMSALPSLPELPNSAPLRRLDIDHQDSSRQQSDFINGLLGF